MVWRAALSTMIRSHVVKKEHAPRPKGRSRDEYVYAIIRLDEFLGVDAPIERRVTVNKVMRDADEAEREAERLNGLQKDAGVRYFVQVTRLEPSDQTSPIQSSGGLTNRSAT